MSAIVLICFLGEVVWERVALLAIAVVDGGTGSRLLALNEILVCLCGRIRSRCNAQFDGRERGREDEEWLMLVVDEMRKRRVDSKGKQSGNPGAFVQQMHALVSSREMN